MKKSEWFDCQRNEFFPKQKGIPSLVKIEHINTATLDSARSKKKSKVAVLQLSTIHTYLCYMGIKSIERSTRELTAHRVYGQHHSAINRSTTTYNYDHLKQNIASKTDHFSPACTTHCTHSDFFVQISTPCDHVSTEVEGCHCHR